MSESILRILGIHRLHRTTTELDGIDFTGEQFVVRTTTRTEQVGWKIWGYTIRTLRHVRQDAAVRRFLGDLGRL
jgi:hypothetical protein